MPEKLGAAPGSFPGDVDEHFCIHRTMIHEIVHPEKYGSGERHCQDSNAEAKRGNGLENNSMCYASASALPLSRTCDGFIVNLPLLVVVLFRFISPFL